MLVMHIVTEIQVLLHGYLFFFKLR